jgi:hypothetical protein
MKVDIKGTPIEVGSKVVFGSAQSMRLQTGVVTKINPKTVAILQEYIGYHWQDTLKANPIPGSIRHQRAFDDVVVI